MQINDIPPALTGNKLLEAIQIAKQQRQVIAEGLIYEKTCLMVSSEPGIGKSTLSTQVAVELASGLPVFGYFSVPFPVKILYIQAERTIIETLERIEIIGRTLPINKDNLIITDEYQRLNLLSPIHSDLMIDCIKRDGHQAKVVFFDPIYSTVSGGLKDDKPATAFTKVMSLLQKETGCALWLNHHDVKPQYSQTGQKIEKDDPFYGSQWLKAHATGSYNVKKSSNGVILTCKKDNYKLLTQRIELEYDAETELCEVVNLDKRPALDKVRDFLRLCNRTNKDFYFSDIQQATELSSKTLRELLLHSSLSSSIIVVSAYKNKRLYRVLETN